MSASAAEVADRLAQVLLTAGWEGVSVRALPGGALAFTARPSEPSPYGPASSAALARTKTALRAFQIGQAFEALSKKVVDAEQVADAVLPGEVDEGHEPD